jgi:two-component system, OmpR family, phosphate regulon response regulator PhoB
MCLIPARSAGAFGPPGSASAGGARTVDHTARQVKGAGAGGTHLEAPEIKRFARARPAIDVARHGPAALLIFARGWRLHCHPSPTPASLRCHTVGVPGVEQMAKILVIEDEPDLQQVLDYNLKQAGHEVIAAQGGEVGLSLAREQRPDLVLLDLMLPDLSGTEVCKSLKDSEVTRPIPVIMLTARGEEIDRVVGFELGADDYVVKPFSVRELLLRIQAILRRGKSGRPSAELVIEFGCLKIDRDAHRVWVENKEIELTALEFRLLLTLYDRKNRVQTRAMLLDDVWGIQADITTRTVDTHVKRLREKLEAARDYVETVRGVGYRFVASAEEAGT